MYYIQLETICKCLFGRSWKSQLADYLAIDRRNIQNWERDGKIPAFAVKELQSLIDRRKFEISCVDDLMSESFDHTKSMLEGRSQNLDASIQCTEEMIKSFLSNQKWRVIEEVKAIKKTDTSLVNDDEIYDYIETDFLSTNDIASWVENNNINCNLDLDYIKELRSEACYDVKQYFMK